MDDFDYMDENKSGRKIGGMVWNVLTGIVLLAVLCVGIVFLTIFFNPYSGINLFPPPTMPALLAYPSVTPTSRLQLPPTWTPSPTLEPSQTFTPEPSFTPFPTETPFSLFPVTTTPTGEAKKGMPFVVSPGTPVGTSSQTFHSEAGCDWLGVAGQVFDLSGAPVSGQQVRIGGTLAGSAVDMLSLTGLTTAYGTAGFYEFVLGTKPVASKGTLWVQLLDQGGVPMSDKIYFDTYDTCDKNLVFVNFKQVR
jgi:hypothetical protein